MLSDYAVRVVCYLASEKRIVSSTELSEQLGIARSIFPKLGKSLCKARIIESIGGVHGGWKLIKREEDITLYDVLSLMENRIKISRCLEDDCFCSRGQTATCPVRRKYIELQEMIEKELKSTTIAELIKGGEKNE